MTDIRHHPTLETLARYAAGHMCEAQSVVIATHATACTACTTLCTVLVSWPELGTRMV